MTGHCNGGCQVGWTGAMCEKGNHLTINNVHEHDYIFKSLYISTNICYFSYHNFMNNNVFCLAKKSIKIMMTEDSTNHTSIRHETKKTDGYCLRTDNIQTKPAAKN